MDSAGGVCGICDKTAHGMHFGAASCRSCASFFRRAVCSKRRSRCKAAGNCAISAEFRLNCKACRFAKCLRVGMDPKAVQPNRDPLGPKALQFKAAEFEQRRRGGQFGDSSTTLLGSSTKLEPAEESSGFRGSASNLFSATSSSGNFEDVFGAKTTTSSSSSSSSGSPAAHSGSNSIRSVQLSSTAPYLIPTERRSSFGAVAQSSNSAAVTQRLFGDSVASGCPETAAISAKLIRSQAAPPLMGTSAAAAGMSTTAPVDNSLTFPAAAASAVGSFGPAASRVLAAPISDLHSLPSGANSIGPNGSLLAGPFGSASHSSAPVLNPTAPNSSNPPFRSTAHSSATVPAAAPLAGTVASNSSNPSGSLRSASHSSLSSAFASAIGSALNTAIASPSPPQRRLSPSSASVSPTPSPHPTVSPHSHGDVWPAWRAVDLEPHVCVEPLLDAQLDGADTLNRLSSGFEGFERAERQLHSLLYPQFAGSETLRFTDHAEQIRMDKGCVPLALDMLDEWFPPLREVDSQQRSVIIRAFYSRFTVFLKCHRTSVFFGGDDDRRIHLCYGQYVSFDPRNGPQHYRDNRNPEDANRHCGNFHQKAITVSRKLRRMAVTRKEFLALAAVMLCNELELIIGTDREIESFRHQIFADLQRYLNRRAIARDGSGARLGALICLLQDADSIAEAVTLLKVFSPHATELWEDE